MISLWYFKIHHDKMVLVWWYKIHLRVLSIWCHAGNGNIHNDEMVSLQWSGIHLKTLSRYYYYVNWKSITTRWDHFGDLRLFLTCYWYAITLVIENLPQQELLILVIWNSYQDMIKIISLWWIKIYHNKMVLICIEIHCMIWSRWYDSTG